MSPTLPPELVAHIASLLDQGDLLTFRLASEQHQYHSLRTCLENYFTRRVHLCTSRSLGVLLGICRHPHLVKCLREIESLQPDNRMLHNEPYKDKYGPPGNIAWEPWIRVSQAIEEGDTTLHEILRHLKRNGVTPKLSVRSSARPDEDRPHGIKRYIRSWD
jgi:hypothetical protein